MMKRMIRGKCPECGATQKFDIGALELPDAIERLEKMVGFECRGEGLFPHVVIGDAWGHYEWHKRYGMDETVEIFEEESEDPPTDEEWLKEQEAQGRKMIRTNELPGGLEHAGWGNFYDKSNNYNRCDSPRGTRYYTTSPRR